MHLRTSVIWWPPIEECLWGSEVMRFPCLLHFLSGLTLLSFWFLAEMERWAPLLETVADGSECRSQDVFCNPHSFELAPQLVSYVAWSSRSWTLTSPIVLLCCILPFLSSEHVNSCADFLYSHLLQSMVGRIVWRWKGTKHRQTQNRPKKMPFTRR